MRWCLRTVAVLLGSLAAGCATSPGSSPSATTPTPTERATPTWPVAAQHERRAAEALVFAPPLVRGLPEPDLARSAREPAAFIGFDSLSETYFWIRSDDRMTNDGSDRFIRRSVSERVGVSYR